MTEGRRQAAAAAFVCACMIGCATAAERPAYLNNVVYSVISSRDLEAPQRIGNARTYGITFTLARPEKCVEVSVRGKRITREYSYTDQSVRVFFIVERQIDLSTFTPAGQRRVYSEIGRNYDQDWGILEKIEVCTSPQDPLKKLDPGLYRIRFAVFEQADVMFTVNVLSNAGDVIFTGK
jgi:hypothetical protein